MPLAKVSGATRPNFFPHACSSAISFAASSNLVISKAHKCPVIIIRLVTGYFFPAQNFPPFRGEEISWDAVEAGGPSIRSLTQQFLEPMLGEVSRPSWEIRDEHVVPTSHELRHPIVGNPLSTGFDRQFPLGFSIDGNDARSMGAHHFNLRWVLFNFGL